MLYYCQEHDLAFEAVILAPLNALGFFKREWDTYLASVDASLTGTGAVLRQINPVKESDRQVVSYASRALSEVERRYSQIEKEALAVIWACERLYLYLIGRKFVLETDNRALQLILANPSSNPPARLRHYGLRLAPIVHRPCLGNMADYLSRHSCL